MSATVQQFTAEVGPLLKAAYAKNQGSRADYKEAVEGVALKKMPQATEDDRKRFVDFALKVYDVMRRVAFNPDTPVLKMGEVLEKALN